MLMQTALNSRQVLLWGSLNPAWFPVKLKKNRLTWVVLVQSMFLICLLDDNIIKIILITLKNISVCHLDLYDLFFLPSLSSETGAVCRGYCACLLSGFRGNSTKLFGR